MTSFSHSIAPLDFLLPHEEKHKSQFLVHIYIKFYHMFLYIMQKSYLQRTIDNIFNTPTRTIRYSIDSKVYQRLANKSTIKKTSCQCQRCSISGAKYPLGEWYRSNKRPRSLATSYRISNGAIIDFAMPCSRRQAACTSNSTQPAQQQQQSAGKATTEEGRRRGRGSFYSA